MIIDIRTLAHYDPADLRRMGYGYVSTEAYSARKVESPEATQITLQLATLKQPHVKHFPIADGEEAAFYERLAGGGFSLGAYTSGELVGLTLAERREWNNTLWVWEFCIDERLRGQGIGRRLMEALAEKARAADIRAIELESQNTNVPAIRFYRAVGFEIDGLDLSHYTNDDASNGEVAIFMKWKL